MNLADQQRKLLHKIMTGANDFGTASATSTRFAPKSGISPPSNETSQLLDSMVLAKDTLQASELSKVLPPDNTRNANRTSNTTDQPFLALLQEAVGAMGTIDTIVTSMIRKEENLLKEIRQLRRIVVNKNKEIAELKVEVALQKEMAMEAMRILESLAREPPTSG